MVTNQTGTRIIRHVRNHEGIRARMWVDGIFGQNDNTLALKFEWLKRTEKGDALPIGFSEHQVSWIRVVGRGVVEPVECPPFFADFFRKNYFAPKQLFAAFGEDKSPNGKVNLTPDLGAPVREYDIAGRNKMVAAETTIDTTMQNSNLAQNVYF